MVTPSEFMWSRVRFGNGSEPKQRSVVMKRMVVVVMAAAAVLAVMVGLIEARAATAPTGLAASWGTDTQINLNWNDVGDETQYYVYRLKPTPIDLSGATVSSGTDSINTAWVDPANAFDANYATNCYTTGGANWTANDWVQVDLASPAYIAAVGLLQTRQPDAANWWRDNFTLDINGSTVSSGGCTAVGGGEAGGRNVYLTLYNNTPVNANSVRVTLQGGVTDSRSAMTEIDLWEVERVATLPAGTTSYNDNNSGVGLTTGRSYAYYVTSYDGAVESALSNFTTTKAGDRDDTNTLDTNAPVAAQPWRNGAYYSAVQPGESDALHAKVAVPAAPTGFAAKGQTISFNASPTEAGSGDVKRYVIYRAENLGAATLIETSASLVSKRVMPYQDLVIDGSTAQTPTNGNRAYNNYGESDDILDFGDGNCYAVTQMVIHQQDNNAQQHCFRAVTLEAAGGYTTDYINLTTNPASSAWLTTRFDTSDTVEIPDTDGYPGYATFGMSPKVGGALPDSWIVGDHLILHFGLGENSVDFDEYEVYGFAVDYLGSVLADGSALYSYLDGTAVFDTNYSYFILAEDYAGNQSLALFQNVLIIPEPASFALLGVGVMFLRRRRGQAPDGDASARH